MRADLRLSNVIRIAKSRCLAGANPSQVAEIFSQYVLLLSSVENFRGKEMLMSLAKKLSHMTYQCGELGAPLAPLYEKIENIAKNLERQILDLKQIERQYALQFAVSMIIPWIPFFVLKSNHSMGFLVFLAVFMQVIAVIAFLMVLKKTTRSKNIESDFLKHFLLGIWFRHAGSMYLTKALSATLDDEELASFPEYLLKWKNFAVNLNLNLFDEQRELRFKLIADWLKLGLEQGVPVVEIARSELENVFLEDHDKIQMNIKLLPTKLVLIQSFFLTPALFLILGGLLWPTITKII